MEKRVSGTITFIGVVLFFFIMKVCSSIIMPFAIAVFIFILVNPIMEKMEKLHVPSPLAMAIVLLIVTCICFIFVYLLFAMVNTVLAKLPEYIYKVTSFDEYVSVRIRNIFSMSEHEFPSIIAMMNIDWVAQIKNALTSISSTSVSVIGDVAMIILYLLFLLLERKTIFPKISAMTPDSKTEVQSLVSNISHQTSRYLYIKVLISGATGILFYLVALVGGLDFPLVWGILAFLLNFIPTIGSIVVTIAVTFMAAIQFMPSWGRVFVLFLFFLAIQTVLGNVIDPKMQGEQLNLSPLVILVMLSLWGYVWGIVGMFLAVPITSVIQVFCNNIPSLHPVAILLSSGYGLKKENSEGKEES